VNVLGIVSWEKKNNEVSGRALLRIVAGQPTEQPAMPGLLGGAQ
jgi:hypothetical protein